MKARLVCSAQPMLATSLAGIRRPWLSARPNPIETHVITWFLPPVTTLSKVVFRNRVYVWHKTSVNLREHFDKFVVFCYSGENIGTAELCASLTRSFRCCVSLSMCFRKDVDGSGSATNAWSWRFVHCGQQHICCSNMTPRHHTRKLMQDYEPFYYPAGNLLRVIEQSIWFKNFMYWNAQGWTMRFWTVQRWTWPISPQV